MDPANARTAVAETHEAAQVAIKERRDVMYWLSRILRVREAFLIAILLAMIVVMSIVQPGFRSSANIRAVLLGFSMEGIVVIGMTMLLVSGGFDLSVGSNMALSGMVSAALLLQGTPIPLAILAGLIAGAAVGLLNAWVVAKVGVNALIATLGTMTIVRGIALTGWQGQPVINLPDAFRSIGQGVLFGILPLPAFILIILMIVFDILMRRGRWFRQLYFVGGSEKAARLSGIHVTRVRMTTYIAAGLLAGLAGVVSTSRLAAAYPNSYDPVALRVISGAVIGGCSLFGGEGSVVGSVLGLFFIALILDILVLLGVSPYAQGIVQGVALILAVVIDIWTKRQAARG
jgi:ribose transport system permease protein